MDARDKLFKYRPNVFHHVVFATKRRKKVLVPPIRDRVLYWIEQQAREHDIELQELNLWLNHGHALIFVRPGENLSTHMQYLKGGSARQIFLEFPDLKWQIGEEHLWAKRFRPFEVPPEGLDRVLQYIRNQEQIHIDRLGFMPVPEWERWIDLE